MKRLIQSGLKHFGYQIERLREPLPGENFYVVDFVLYILNEHRNNLVKFLQIGANDGVQEDPCYAWLRRYPWQGIMVEPQPKLAGQLRQMYRGRRGILVEEAVIADRSGHLDFYYLADQPGVPSWATGIASLDYHFLMAHRSKIPQFDAALRKTTVAAYTFNDFLDRHHIQTLDFLQIDAEGYDARILASIDFHRIKPTVIAYEEHHSLPRDEQIACRAKLASAGYRFGAWDGQICSLPT